MSTFYSRAVKLRLYRCRRCGRYFTVSEHDAESMGEVTCPYCNNPDVEYMGEY